MSGKENVRVLDGPDFENFPDFQQSPIRAGLVDFYTILPNSMLESDSKLFGQN